MCIRDRLLKGSYNLWPALDRISALYAGAPWYLVRPSEFLRALMGADWAFWCNAAFRIKGAWYIYSYHNRSLPLLPFRRWRLCAATVSYTHLIGYTGLSLPVLIDLLLCRDLSGEEAKKRIEATHAIALSPINVSLNSDEDDIDDL